MRIRRLGLIGLICLAASVCSNAGVGRAQSSWEQDWERVQAAARKEGKLVINVPPDTQLRRTLEPMFKRRYGIELELVLGRGAVIAGRVADEYKAGVRYFDLFFTTVDNMMDRLLPMGAIENYEATWILPEVKDPKNWWGGHIWNDKAKRYAYSASAYMLDNVWYNGDLVRADEVRSYDDLLNPKWKGKIGFLDPRLGGAGVGIWGFLWANKGEDFLRKLVQQQQLVISEDRIQAESLARGKLAIAIGPTHYRFEPFIKAGINLKPFAPLKEGSYAAVGVGSPVLIKNSPNPNAAKVFINWFVSKEGQEVWGRVHGHATRRMDVETKSLERIGVRGAKDFLTIQEFYKYENQSEDKVLTVRAPSREFARKILP